MFGILRKRTACTCSENSSNWSWPFTRAHEKYQGRVVTTVTCMKHAWSVRLYDDKQMRFMTFSEEQAVLHQMQLFSPVQNMGSAHSAMNTMAPAGV